MSSGLDLLYSFTISFQETSTVEFLTTRNCTKLPTGVFPLPWMFCCLLRVMRTEEPAAPRSSSIPVVFSIELLRIVTDLKFSATKNLPEVW